MMKLNNKGYMLVEIIVASVLAVGIAYYLLNLTYKFKNTYEDVNESYYYMKDKIVVTKSIMSDLEDDVVTSCDYVAGRPYVVFNAIDDGEEVTKWLFVLNNEIKYGKVVGVQFVTDDESYYYKNLEDTLVVGEMKFSEDQSGCSVVIPIESIYDENDYSIKIFASK